MNSSWLVLLAASLLLPGCYLQHGVGGTGDPVSPLDSSPTPRPVPRDASTVDVVERDTGFDAEYRPRDPDPDLGPESRPSDYPEASDWLDPPDIDDADSCCVIGEPIRVTAPDDTSYGFRWPVDIAWGPGRWALLTAKPVDVDGESQLTAVVLELERDGTPIATPRVLDVPMGETGDIDWADGRWAVAASGLPHVGENTFAARVQLFDGDFRPVSVLMTVGGARTHQLALARLTHGDRWVAVRGADRILALNPFHDRGSDPTVEVSSLLARALDTVGMRSRIVVVGPREGGRDEVVVLGADPDYAELGRVALPTQYDEQMVITDLRDLVIVAGIDEGRTGFEVIDPFAVTRVGGTGTLDSRSFVSDWPGAIGIAGSSKLGVAGVCYGVETDDGVRRLDFRLIGPDGVLRGRPVEAMRTLEPLVRPVCAVGHDEHGFLVAWWDGATLWVRRVFVAR